MLNFTRPEILDMFKGLNFSITSFKLTLRRSNGRKETPVVVQHVQNGKGFNLVNSANKGDIFIIDEIKYRITRKNCNF